MNKETETCITKLISFAGTARSNYIKAIDALQNGEEDYRKLQEEGNVFYQKAHEEHFHLMQLEPQEESDGLMLVMHAEDQLMCAETFRILTDKFIALYKNKQE